MSINTSFSVQDFISLEITAKRAIYQQANETQNIDLVRQMNDLGMRPKVASFSRPTIISTFMDIATKYDTVLGFLKELRQTNRLLTQKEFKSLSDKKWVRKSKLSRILGCDHLAQKIRENKSIHIRVPLKVAVFEETESLKVIGFEYMNNLYDIESDQITIYAEEIKSVERKLSRDEIDDLIQIISTAIFSDLWPENIMVTIDGIYFIDTEFKSFSGSIDWGKMGRFESLISEEDKVYFRKKVQEKIDGPKAKKEINGYDDLTDLLALFNELPEIKQNRDKIEEIKNKISNLEYVGAKEVGSSWLKPNHFSFNLKDIL